MTALGQRNILRRVDIERKTETVRAVMTGTTTVAVEEAIAAANIPEEIRELDGHTILTEFSRQPVRRWFTTSATMVISF